MSGSQGAPRQMAWGPRLACCCAVGCAVLVLGLAGAALLGWTRVGAPVMQGLRDVAEAQEEAARARAELARVDEQHPPEEVEDPAELDLTAVDLDAYVAVRRELAPRLAEVVAAREELESGVRPDGAGAPSFRDVFGAAISAAQGGSRLAAARRDLLQAATEVLPREGLGPTRLERIARLVEWRFLREPDALLLGLPDWRRSELFELRLEVTLLEGWGQAGQLQVNGRESEEALAEARQRLAELEAEARADEGLSDATRALLAERRASLESLSAEAAPVAVLFEPTDTGLRTD